MIYSAKSQWKSEMREEAGPERESAPLGALRAGGVRGGVPKEGGDTKGPLKQPWGPPKQL